MSSGRFVFWSQVRIGLVISLLAISGCGLIFFIDDVQELLEDRYTLHFHTATNQPLRPRTPVWLAGQPVGYVSRLQFEPPSAERDERLHVDLNIKTVARPTITEGVAVQIITSGLLGEIVVNLLPATEPTAPLAPGSEIPTADELDPSELTARFRALYDSLGPLLNRWQRVADTIRSGRGTVQLLAESPTEPARLHALMGRLSGVLDTLGMASRRALEVLSEPDVSAALGRIGPRLTTLAKLFENRQGTMARAAADTALPIHLRRIVDHISSLETRVAEGRGTMGRLLHDRVLMEELTEARRRIEVVKAELQAVREGQRPPP